MPLHICAYSMLYSEFNKRVVYLLTVVDQGTGLSYTNIIQCCYSLLASALAFSVLTSHAV